MGTKRDRASTVRVEGIVHDEALAQPGEWYVMFLLPWRHPDGRVIDEQLRVAHDVPRATARAAQRSYRSGVAVRVTASKLEKPPGFTYWNAVGITKVQKLRSLALAAPELVAIQHPLGRLELDAHRGAFVGKRGRVRLTIDRIDGLLDTATKRVRAAEDLQPTIRAAVSKKLLPLYNDTWREPRRPILDATAFDRVLKLNAIDVGTRRTTLYYSSGSLFTDHGVEVRLGPRGAISEISLS